MLITALTVLGLAGSVLPLQEQPQAGAKPEAAIVAITPPESGFYAKKLDLDGIPIKAPAVVADKALLVARDRLSRMLAKIPNAHRNLAERGVELHIIGKDQVTSDLPEHRHLKGKPFDGKLTVDERTRGLGGRMASCGEENLLELPTDRYRGRDICTHEFAHTLQNFGLSEDVRKRIRDQYNKSLEKGLWKDAYAATNEGEYFAELTMWYFGTHGDNAKLTPKPADGPEGLRAYDPDAYALLDDLYTGRLPIARNPSRTRLKAEPPATEAKHKSGKDSKSTAIHFVNRTGMTLTLYWLDYDGKRQSYGTISPGEQHDQNTFVSHVWLLTDAEGKGIALFVAGAKPGIAEIIKTESGKE